MGSMAEFKVARGRRAGFRHGICRSSRSGIIIFAPVSTTHPRETQSVTRRVSLLQMQGPAGSPPPPGAPMSRIQVTSDRVQGDRSGHHAPAGQWLAHLRTGPIQSKDKRTRMTGEVCARTLVCLSPDDGWGEL